MPAPRRAGFASRMTTYLAEMYPLPQRLLAALVVGAGFATLAARIHGLPSRLLPREALLGAWSVFSLLLILRLMDELKDVEVDRALFPHRPLPAGKVRAWDLTASAVAVATLYLGAHLGSGLALASAAVCLGYACLMLRWFFVPDLMRRRLPLALATHTPIVPLLFGHLLVLFAVEHGRTAGGLHWGPALLAVGLYWALSFAWEISRKIRAPEEEDAYVTYSRLLGPRGAVLLAGGAQSVAFAAGLALLTACGLSWSFAAVLTAGYGTAVVGHLRFLKSPSRATSQLRPFAEVNLLAACVAGWLA
jgi:hypothetical protein